MDDSRAALSKAYNAVRERYNKLRLHHRQLLRDRTCPRCHKQRHASVGMEDSADMQTTSILSQSPPSDANEIHEICDRLKQLAEAGQVADESCIVHSIIPRLQNVASRLATNTTLNTTFDDQQDSLFNASASEVASSLSTLSCLPLEADLLQSQQQGIVPSMVGTTEGLAPSATCEMDSDQLDTNLIAGKCHDYLSTTTRLPKQS